MILIVANVEAKPGEGPALIEAFEDYAKIVRENEPGVLFFDIQINAANSHPDHFVYLEGFEDDAAIAAHDAQPYKAAHVENMRKFMAKASAKKFQERAW